MEIFPRFAVGFRWNDQDASRVRIFSWSGQHTKFQPSTLPRDCLKISGGGLVGGGWLRPILVFSFGPS